MRRFTIWSLVTLVLLFAILVAMRLEGVSSVSVVNTGQRPITVKVSLGPRSLGEATLAPGSSYRWFYVPVGDADYQIDCKSNASVRTYHLDYITIGMALLSRIEVASCDHVPSERSIDWLG